MGNQSTLCLPEGIIPKSDRIDSLFAYEWFEMNSCVSLQFDSKCLCLLAYLADLTGTQARPHHTLANLCLVRICGTGDGVEFEQRYTPALQRQTAQV